MYVRSSLCTWMCVLTDMNSYAFLCEVRIPMNTYLLVDTYSHAILLGITYPRTYVYAYIRAHAQYKCPYEYVLVCITRRYYAPSCLRTRMCTCPCGYVFTCITSTYYVQSCICTSYIRVHTHCTCSRVYVCACERVIMYT